VPASQDSRVRLKQYFDAEHVTLLHTLRHYVVRARLASGDAVNPIADEIFNDMVVEAFRNASRLKPDMQARPWLLGIAGNLVKRKQIELAKRERREPLLRDLYPQTQHDLSDEELFDLLPTLSVTELQEIELNQNVSALLVGVASADADIIRLAILHDLNGDALAKALGVGAGAARTRLYRALYRLRDAYHARQKKVTDA
jgi:DNA-directed RNA polymerase specialized sigma24 family protein